MQDNAIDTIQFPKFDFFDNYATFTIALNGKHSLIAQYAKGRGEVGLTKPMLPTTNHIESWAIWLFPLLHQIQPGFHHRIRR